MNLPSIERLSREEIGEQDAARIDAFYRRLEEGGMPQDLLNQVVYQYCIHVYVLTRENEARRSRERS